MSSILVISVLVGYFSLLIAISYFTSRDTNDQSFYTGDKTSPWYVVSFGMIGASLSGITFLSIPGAVADKGFSYMQMVFGYTIGYLIIAKVLLPIYYKYNLVSIYAFLGKRFGKNSQMTGSFFFLISRIVGASLRLFLVALILDKAIFQFYEIPFWLTVAVTILLIWIYTFRGGIKTVVWTDIFQTAFMLGAVILTIYIIYHSIDTEEQGWSTLLGDSGYTKIFYWEGENNFLKMFLSGIFITVVMTGLDQDMMQKNLTVGTLKDSQKNMYWLSVNIVLVNSVFLLLGAMLYIYSEQLGVVLPERKDLVFAELALNHLPLVVGIPFILGTVAAAYSSADSALTSLTTSFSIDFLEFNGVEVTKKKRMQVHVAFSLVLFLVILIFSSFNNESIVWVLFKAAGLTYGPLLGIFILGIFTKINLKDSLVPVVCGGAAIASILLFLFSDTWFNYTFGIEISLISTSVTILGLLMIRNRDSDDIDL